MKTLFACITVPISTLVLITHVVIASDFAELETRANQGGAEAMYELGEKYENGVETIQNYVEAHKWYNIAASRGYVKALNARDAIAEKMIAEQLAEAQKLAIKWKPSNNKVSEGRKQITGDFFDAVHGGDIETLKELLIRNADQKKIDKEGWFPLMFAAFGGHKGIVEALINAGADINRKVNDGSTALIAATLQGHKSIVKLLLEKGADKSVKNNYGVTALSIARQSGYDEIAVLLTINLRSSYRDLGYDQVKTALKENNFFDHHRNETGDFINDYELRTIKGDDVVQDQITGLMWYQSGSDKDMKWEDAKKWIKDLNEMGYAGYHDWRLPTVEEAASLLEPIENNDNLYIDPVFNQKQRLIWTGDSFGSRGAWNVNFSTGGVIWRFTDLNLYVRPVRSDKL